jgi:hypothetical protein
LTSPIDNSIDKEIQDPNPNPFNLTEHY